MIKVPRDITYPPKIKKNKKKRKKNRQRKEKYEQKKTCAEPKAFQSN